MFESGMYSKKYMLLCCTFYKFDFILKLLFFSTLDLKKVDVSAEYSPYFAGESSKGSFYIGTNREGGGGGGG